MNGPTRSGGCSRVRWRVFPGSSTAQIVPQAKLSGPMPWVISIMVALTVIALSAGLAMKNMATAAQAELEGGITIQILEPQKELRDAQSKAVLSRLREVDGILSLRLLPQSEVDALIEPWLGKEGRDGYSAAVPVPALIDVGLDGPLTQARLEEVRGVLAETAPEARADAQSSWLEPVFDAISSLQWLALALVGLLALALGSAVLLAARTALGANRDTIEIVHLLGGTDSQIARVFQRSIGFDAAGGGVVGFVLAVVVILFLGRRFAGLGAGMVDQGALKLVDWLVLGFVPVLAVVLAMITARLTVMHALRKML